MRQTALVFVGGLLLACCWGGALPSVDGDTSAPAAGRPPAAPPVPADLPPPREPAWGELLDDRPGWEDVDLGVGALEAVEPPSGSGTAWFRGVLLPVYERPGEPLAGWIAHGWWLPAGGGAATAEPLSARCLLETSYEQAAFVLYEIRADGWLRLGVRPPCDGAGSAWVHRDHLQNEGTSLAVRRWEELLRARSGFLYFRQAEVRHALRVAPDAESERLVWIGENHDLEMLEVRDDWMRVRVYQPAHQCLPPEAWRGTVKEGWVRWRSHDKGPWIWYPPRGC